jgi:lipid-A-disaccharide synthase
MEQWRELLYPLGFLSSLAFTLRFLIQWVNSERAKNSVVTASFWRISLAGNLLLLVHSLIQVQFHVCVVQACNAVISWRNLNLMGPPNKQWRLLSVISLLGGAIAVSSICFAVQGLWIADNESEWFRTPIMPWAPNTHFEASWGWHLAGSLGILLFNSRFWVQWWEAETYRRSYLSTSFWWLSLAGALLSLIYFVRLGDAVNFIGPLFGLIPYARNLMLIRQAKRRPAQTGPGL